MRSEQLSSTPELRANDTPRTSGVLLKTRLEFTHQFTGHSVSLARPSDGVSQLDPYGRAFFLKNLPSESQPASIAGTSSFALIRRLTTASRPSVSSISNRPGPTDVPDTAVRAALISRPALTSFASA